MSETLRPPGGPIESLERRRLLAAELAQGTLIVAGDNEPNRIDVSITAELCDPFVRTDIDGAVQLFPIPQISGIVIRGLAGDDHVTVRDVNDPGNVEIPIRIIGADGDDLLYGSLGDDSINGGAGDDTLYGLAGDDVLIGADGSDNLYGDEGGDLMNGGDGRDRMYGGEDRDTVNGGPGHDLVRGQEGDDLLIGGFGVDSLLGSQGRDTFLSPASEHEDREDWEPLSLDGGDDGDDSLGGSDDDDDDLLDIVQ